MIRLLLPGLGAPGPISAVSGEGTEVAGRRDGQERLHCRPPTASHSRGLSPHGHSQALGEVPAGAGVARCCATLSVLVSSYSV